jgi:hypothetical protein
MKHDTAGDPMTGLKWTRRTTGKIAKELRFLGIQISRTTVGKLLKQMKYSLRVNRKKLGPAGHPDRNAQFANIGDLRERFAQQGDPIISVDTKKKEKVGSFKNPGAAWNREPVLVNDHDFKSRALGMAIPYGVYDMQANRGSIFVGTSHDTATFAVESIAKWWSYDGRWRYPGAKQLLILADGGGSNSSRCRAWKRGIQGKLCDRYGLSVTVSHYPPGASKWNPIEHRLFGEVSKNWAGEPLESYEKILNYMRTTKTTTGLNVKAYLIPKHYAKGVKVSDDEMSQLRITSHTTLPKWNYTLSPPKNGK